MKIIIIPQNEVEFFTGTTSTGNAIAPSPLGDYDFVLPAIILDDPAHKDFFNQQRIDGHNIWAFQTVEYSKWGSFSLALMSSTVGQRVMAGTATNVYASFASALASSNVTNISAILPTISAVYSLTAQEKIEFNLLIDKYAVELPKLL